MSLEHSEVNENNFLKIVVNLGIFGVKHYRINGFLVIIPPISSVTLVDLHINSEVLPKRME